MSIVVEDISKSFGAYRALDHVSLSVPSGKLVGLLGPSGSGKTTLLRIIAGLDQADQGSGRIEFHGQDVSAVTAGQRNVGFVFQHYALFRHMTVFENIAFGLRVRHRRLRPKETELADRVHALLRLVQLDGLEKRFPSQLSGGQRQRVALARALAVEPKVLLLDEPFGALDARVRKDLRRWLRRFHDEIHITTVFVTHDQEEALEISDEVVIMNQAKVEQVGTPQEVYDRPASPFVYQFLGNVNTLREPAVWSQTGPIHATGRLTDAGLVYVRPHDIEVRRHEAGELGLPAVLRYIHAAGSQVRLSLEVVASREKVEAEISRTEFVELSPRLNDVVLVRLRAANPVLTDYAI